MNNDKLKQIVKRVNERNGTSLQFVFAQCSKEMNLKENTIRNMYYNALKKAKFDTCFAKSIFPNLQLKKQKKDILLNLDTLKNFKNKSETKKDKNVEEFEFDDEKEYPDNVIMFKQNNSLLSDLDLQSLFMGLLKIVKTNAVLEVNNTLRERCNSQSIQVRNLLKEISFLRDELQKSKKEKSKIKKDVDICQLNKIEKYELLINKNKKTAQGKGLKKDVK